MLWSSDIKVDNEVKSDMQQNKKQGGRNTESLTE